MKKLTIFLAMLVFLAGCYVAPPQKTTPTVKKTDQPNNTNKSDVQKSSGSK